MKLEPGYYKVAIKERMLTPSCHYLRVFIKDKHKYFQVDHEFPQKADEIEQGFIEEYKILKKITNPVKVQNIEFKLTWIDEDGDHFEMGGKNVFVLEGIFKDFPRVAKAFGIFMPRAGKKKNK